MHESSHEAMRAFVRVHLGAARGRPLDILDFGSQMVDEQPLSYLQLLDDPEWRYRGLDIEPGLNVDIVVDDPYDWRAVESDSVDLVISGQAFEHVEFFWASMFEIVRVLRPGGLATIIAPSGGFEHRYPVDCWRFYRDGFAALARHVGCDIVDVFTDWGHGDWEDSILVARKPVWDDAGRMTFHRRAALQRLLVSADAALDVDFVPPGDPGEVSILRDAHAGALTAELGVARAERLVQEAAATAASAAQVEARIDAEATRRTQEQLAAIPSRRLYGAIRRRASHLAGQRGRAVWERFRHRAQD